MAFSKFRSIGLFFLESETGDYMIASSGMKMNTIMRRDLVVGVKTNSSMADMLARQIVNFLEKYRDARKDFLFAKVEIARKIDPGFADKMAKYLEQDNMRKVEKDFFFWERDNNCTIEVPLMSNVVQ